MRWVGVIAVFVILKLLVTDHIQEFMMISFMGGWDHGLTREPGYGPGLAFVLAWIFSHVVTVSAAYYSVMWLFDRIFTDSSRTY